jgi:hypothetical protein
MHLVRFEHVEHGAAHEDIHRRLTLYEGAAIARRKLDGRMKVLLDGVPLLGSEFHSGGGSSLPFARSRDLDCQRRVESASSRRKWAARAPSPKAVWASTMVCQALRSHGT